MSKTLLGKIVAGVLSGVVAVGLVGCSSSTPGTSSSTSENKTVTLGIVSGWNDMIDSANVYKYILEKNGYAVKIEELSDIATMYAGTAKGDKIDAFSTAPETIHKAYWDKYNTQLEELGAYYSDASIYIAVPDYVSDVKSLTDLASHAADFDGKIVGIEPGAGISSTTQNSVIPAYGLDAAGYTLQTSSTAAMSATLKKAVEAKKPIAVTVWSPYWLNSTFNLRKLEDPKGAFGSSYAPTYVARKGFAQEQPEVANLMKNFKLTTDQFNTLDDEVFNQFKPGEEQQAVKAWFDKNPDLLTQWESYLKD